MFSGLAAGPADGDPVVMLHGFPVTSYAWRHQVAALGAAGFRVLAPDLRGYCDTARPAGVDSYRLDAFAGDVTGIADAIGADRIHLVGHDVGGIVAWYVAARQPDRVRTLAVASTPHLVPFAEALDDSGSGRRVPPFGLFRQPGVAEAALTANDAALLRAGWAGLEPSAVDRYLRLFTRPDALTATLDTFRAFDFAAWRALPDVTVATLFVWGETDPYLDPYAAKATGAHVSGPYRAEELAGVGHWVSEAAPQQLTDLLVGHLATRSHD